MIAGSGIEGEIGIGKFYEFIFIVFTLGGDALEGHTLPIGGDLLEEPLQKGQERHLFEEVFQKIQVRRTRNRRACMIRCMNVDEVEYARIVPGGILEFLPTPPWEEA